MFRRVAAIVFAAAVAIGGAAAPAGAEDGVGAGVDGAPPVDPVVEPAGPEPDPAVALAPDTPVSDADVTTAPAPDGAGTIGSPGVTDGASPGPRADEIPADAGTVTSEPDVNTIDEYDQSVADATSGAGEPTDPQVAESDIMPVSVEDTATDDGSVAGVVAAAVVVVAAGGAALWVLRSRRSV